MLHLALKYFLNKEASTIQLIDTKFLCKCQQFPFFMRTFVPPEAGAQSAAHVDNSKYWRIRILSLQSRKKWTLIPINAH